MNIQKYWRDKKDSTTQLTVVLLILYLIVLVWILVFKLNVRFSYMGDRKANFIPFNEPLVLNGKVDFGEMILNVFIFVPLGIYTGILLKKWGYAKKLLLFFFVSLGIEALQYILRIGAFDVTDIITNSLGGIMGLLLLTAIEKVFNNSLKTQKMINIIATIGTVFIISFLVLLKINMLPIRYQ